MKLHQPYRERNAPLNGSVDRSDQINPKFGHDKRFASHRKYNIKYVWERQNAILHRVALGDPNVDIARDFNTTPQTISNIRNSKVSLAILDQHRSQLSSEMEDINERVSRFAPVALQLIEQLILNDEVPLSLRAKYAAEHLNRAGYGPVHKNLNINRQLTREDIEQIKQRSRAAAREAGFNVI